MLIVGLTGSIGMGKSTTAALFRQAGIPVHDADAAVHRLYSGPAAEPVERLFPGVMRDGTIDRKLLGERVIGNAVAMAALEALIHPLVVEEERRFLAAATAGGHSIVVLDIPLLFEAGGASRVDVIAVVSASAATQKARALARPHMTEERLAAILAKQMPDAEKRRRAHVIIPSETMAAARSAVHGMLRSLAFAR